MDSELAMRQAYEARLPMPLEKVTLGAAFKALLEYHRDQKYDWALEDDLMFTVNLELSEPEKATGIMGFLGMKKAGSPTSLVVGLERALDSVSADDDEDDETAEQFEAVLLELEYDIGMFQQDELDEFDGLYEDSTEYDSVEDFVKAVLENPAFMRLAMLPAKQVEFVMDDMIV